MNQTLQPMFVSQHSQHPSQFVPQGAQVITMQGPQIGVSIFIQLPPDFCGVRHSNDTM